MGWMRPDPSEADPMDILDVDAVARHRRARNKGLALMVAATAFIYLNNIDDRVPIPKIMNTMAAWPVGLGAARMRNHNWVLLRHDNAVDQLNTLIAENERQAVDSQEV